MIKVINEAEVKRAMDESGLEWSLSAILADAETAAMENGWTNRDFVDECSSPRYEIAIDCVKPAEYSRDEDGDIDQEIAPAEYEVRYFEVNGKRVYSK